MKNITMLVAIAAICLAAFSVVSRQQPADKPDDHFWAEMYKKLYFGQVAANLAVHSALIERMNQGDYKTVRGVLLADLKGQLVTVGIHTNYPWSDDQKKSIAMAEKCLKENEKK